MPETKSTCCYCGVGCGVVIETDGGQITGVRGDPDHPANFGRLCTKGATLHLTAGTSARALFPQLRASRGPPRKRVAWDEALDFAADKFAAIIREHGPDSVAFYVSGQLLTEDYYVFNKLAKGLIRTNNIDSNSRLCMSSAVAGYKLTLGADAPPACYEDIAHADCLFIAGANMAYAHPVLFRRIEDAKSANPDLRIIVVDPRRTDTAAAADLFLPILPGTDIALYNAMLHVMLWEGLCDMDYIRDHTEGFDALKHAVREYTPQAAAAICGVPAADIVQAAKWFGAAKATLSFYCQGLNQSSHGTNNNAALINLHLATRQIGKPGAGPLSLTGQPNAMGGREVGGMANLLSAHRDLADPGHRAEVARLWGVDSVPDKSGRTAVEMFDAISRGEIKAVWIACTNPAQSMPNQKQVRAALERAELVVVQEAYRNTETAAYADVLLPATTWGEKEGTVTNSERRISRVRAAVAAPGEARHDWAIAVDFARRLGRRLGNPLAPQLFSYETPEQIFNEHRESTRGRDLDITGMSYALLETRGPQQWPFPQGARDGQVRLYGDGIFPTASGRARFIVVGHHATAEKTDARYPLALNTGRLRDQWHGMSRTGTVARLFNHVEEPLLAMHARDMERRGLKTGDIARVKSRRGELVVRVESSDQVRAAQAFMPMHWGSRFMRGAGANALTVADFDPVSKQPELKHAAIEVEKLELPHRVVAMRRFAAAEAGAVQVLLESLQPFLERFDYATLGLTGRDDVVVVLRGYAAAPVADGVLDALDRLLNLHEAERTMRYVDARRRVEKAARIEDGMVQSVCMSGETAAQEWLKNMMVQGASADAMRSWILAPVAAPPRGSFNRGVTVCNCFDISEAEIRTVLAAGADLAQLQRRLKCGTDCGSCLPELKRLCASAGVRCQDSGFGEKQIAALSSGSSAESRITNTNHDFMSFAHYIKEIGRGTEGAGELSEQDAYQLFGAMLDGGVPELELGAILLALRMRSEALSELIGFFDALNERLFRLCAPSGKAKPVLLPSYSGARHQPNLLPLLALLLQRFGVPVLVHGTLNGNGRVASAYVFRELGIMPCANLTQAQDALDNQGIAFAPTAVLAPGLADLLSLRGRLGVRSSAHLIAKLIDPFDGGGLRVVSASHSPYLEKLHEFLLATGAHALLLRSTEGEPFANPERRPRIEYFHDATAQVLFEAETGPLKNIPTLPAGIDAATAAAWIKRVLAGEAPVPLPIVNQLACCLFASGYANDMNQAKAIVAVETGSLAAA